MKKCNSCNISFNTTSKLCPLCQNKLIGNAKSVFPINYKYRSSVLLNKILLFFSITAFIICSFIDFQINKTLTWSIIVLLGLITNLIIIRAILKSYKDTLGMLGRYGVVLMVILFIWYFYTKNSIITNFIIPILCLLELGFTVVIGIILRNTYIIKYLKIILLNIFISIIPGVLVVFDLVTYPLIAYISAILSVIVLIGIIIFYSEDLKDELHRIFNY